MKVPFLNIVLYEPEIPYNTGNIGRLCVGLNCRLHLIEPLGFKLTDRMLRRAGLDYWDKLDHRIYDSLEEFFRTGLSGDFYYSSTKAEKPYFKVNFKKGDFIFFGKESGGLPDVFHTVHKHKGLFIPMPGEIRSLNLCNSAAVIMYEAYRQVNLSHCV